MAEIINLRRERRQRDRAEAAVKAAENRIVHGRTKAERARDRKQAEQDRREHDAHKLDTGRRDEP